MQRADPISWPTARRVARRISGNEPFSNSYLAGAFERDLVHLTRRAEAFIFKATGLQADGPARIRVTDRAGWVDANLAIFRRVMRPLTDRLQGNSSRIGMQVTGTQFGLVMGWMSTRVLGQYDLVLDRNDQPEEQDYLYYVTPNILALEKRYAFPPEQFRLWIALHECTHRAQFTGVPWLPDYFRSLIDQLLNDVEPDSRRLGDGLRQLLEDRKSRDSAKGQGMFAYFATPTQREVLDKLSGLMALLEGHADVTMSRAATSLVPDADRFHRVMTERRTSSVGVAKLFQRLLGMEAKLRQYIEGAGFVKYVEEHTGRDYFDLVWQRAENLPTGKEIRDPHAWIQRMQSSGHPLAPA